MSLHVETRGVDDLIPYVSNSRTHSDDQVAQIAASIREFGWTNPILIDARNGVIAGHGRLLAARKLGENEVPVIVLDHLTEDQRRAYIIADNKLALNAGWDLATLSSELKALDGKIDISLTGFSPPELEKLLALADVSAGLTDPDDVPDARTDAVSRPGDLWILGKHRVLCGDSTVATDVGRLLGEVSPHLMVTDPPYGVEYEAGWRSKAFPEKNDPSRWRDGAGRAVGKVSNDDRADWRDAWALFPGAVAYVWHAGNKAHIVAESLMATGFDLRAQVIWAKSQFVVGRGHYHPHHEPCWYAVKPGPGGGHWNGDRKQSTLWQIDKPRKSETGHSTQKPIECMQRPIENNSSPGQAVYDPFLGSGTTVIAAERTGRTCYGLELNPSYVDVIVKRWQDFTGGKAKHAETGALFDDLPAKNNAAAA